MKTKNRYLILVAFSFALSATSASAQTPTPTAAASPTPTPKIITSFTGMVSSRYDISNAPNKFNRLQESIVFGFSIAPSGIVELVGMLQTGSAYGKKWQTAHDYNDSSKSVLSPTLYFKHLYLQKSFSIQSIKSQAELGVIGTNQKIGTKSLVGPTTAIGTNAWIDGGRFSVQTPLGNISVTAGSIHDVVEADPLKRDRDLNYFEIQISRTLFEKLSIEASGGKLDGETFIRSALEYDLQILSDKIIRLVQEGLYNTNGSFSYSTTASTDLGVILAKSLQGRVLIDLRYSYTDSDVGFRTQTMNDLTLKGSIFSAGLYGKVDRNGRLNWFMMKDFGDLKRFQTGLNWKFKGGNKK